MFKKVLILSASAGAGHIRAAQAIERACAEMNAAEEVRHVDTLEYTNKIFRNLYSKAYIEMVNKAPEVLGWPLRPIRQAGQERSHPIGFRQVSTPAFSSNYCISTTRI